MSALHLWQAEQGEMWRETTSRRDAAISQVKRGRLWRKAAELC
jgi:hypothetical protein